MFALNTLPFSTLVLLGLTLPFSVRLARHRVLPSLLGALLLVGLYFLFGMLLASVARNGSWNPVVLAWLAQRIPS